MALTLTKAQRKLLRDIADGGCFFAALRRSVDYFRDDVLFSESVGIIVHPSDGRRESRYRVRNQTVAPLYLATPPLVLDDHHGNNGGGFRSYSITDAGREALAQSQG